MEFMEDSQILSLFSDDASLWGPPPDAEVLRLKSESKVSTGLDTFGDPLSPLSPSSDISGDDPLPEWMSEKVALSAWLGDEEDIPMAGLMTIPEPSSPTSLASEPSLPASPLPASPLQSDQGPGPKVQVEPVPITAHELFQELLEDLAAPSSALPVLGEENPSVEELLALSPNSSCSGPASPAKMEGGSLSGSEPPSPAGGVATAFTLPEGVDLESQALALLDAMGCMDFTPANTQGDLSTPQIITVTIPSTATDQLHMQQDITYHAPSSPESLQSTAPSSPASSLSPPPTPVRKSRSKPKLKNASPIDRKSRKRDQNKNAATRYRIKKREETESLTNELASLESTNKSLKDKVEGLEKEITYLKDLLLEVRHLKGQINTIKS